MTQSTTITTLAQSPAHAISEAMSTSLLTTSDLSIIPVDNDPNWENIPALEDQDLPLPTPSSSVDQRRPQHQPIDPLDKALNQLADNLILQLKTKSKVKRGTLYYGQHKKT